MDFCESQSRIGSPSDLNLNSKLSGNKSESSLDYPSVRWTLCPSKLRQIPELLHGTTVDHHWPATLGTSEPSCVEKPQSEFSEDHQNGIYFSLESIATTDHTFLSDGPLDVISLMSSPKDLLDDSITPNSEQSPPVVISDYSKLIHLLIELAGVTSDPDEWTSRCEKLRSTLNSCGTSTLDSLERGLGKKERRRALRESSRHKCINRHSQLSPISKTKDSSGRRPSDLDKVRDICLMTGAGRFYIL